MLNAPGSPPVGKPRAGIDCKSQDVRRALRVSAPDGVNLYLDNVGGDILDAVLTRLARGARIVICGAVSQYNATDGVRGPQNHLALLVARASMTGIVIFDCAPRYGEAASELAAWMADGWLISREHASGCCSHPPIPTRKSPESGGRSPGPVGEG
jgi:NADPH-dependent curcumin reductase CurA